MIITDAEKRVTVQHGRIIHAKIIILDFNFQIIDEITGVVLNGSSYSIDATSDIRRTCSISLIPTNSNFEVKYGSYIWIDKYFQIFIGIEDYQNNNEIVYSNIGLYIINNPKEAYDATNNTLTINGIDLMAKITGLRNGYLEGITYQIKANSRIKDVMQNFISEECGFTRYSIDQPIPTFKVPSDLSFDIGSTAFDVVSQLRDINSNYQIYFDQEGVFWFNKIPSGADEQIMVDDDIWEKVLISYSKESNFEDVKNYIEVFGKTQSDGNTPYGLAYDNNANSPFYVGLNFENTIRMVLSGGEYDNIYPLADYETSITDFNSLAQQRADYELYLRCKLQNQLELNCIPIYWLDVNWLVNITLPNQEESEKYIIKKISTSIGENGTQNITLMKYYPSDINSTLIYCGTPIKLRTATVGASATNISDDNGEVAIFNGGSEAIAKSRLFTDSLIQSNIDSITTRYLASTTVKNHALFAGGCNISKKYTRKLVYSFDSEGNRTQISDLPRACCWLSATAINDTVNDKYYAIFAGGFRSYNYNVSNGAINNATAYDDQLTKLSIDSLSVSRYNLASTTVGNKAIFFGGNSNDINNPMVNTIDIYDSDLVHTTLNVPSTIKGVCGAAATTIGGYGLFFGGMIRRTTSGSTMTPHGFYIDNSLTISTNIEKLPMGVSNAGATTIGNYAVFGGGGFTEIDWSYMFSMKNVCVYDSSLTRTDVSDLSIARTSVAAVTVGDYVLFGGGKNYDNEYSTIDVYAKV